MAIPLPPLPQLLINTNLNSPSVNLSPLINLFPRPINRRASSVVCCKARNGLASEDKRKLLEQYGFNPDEYLSESSPQRKRRKGLQKTGRGNEVPLGEPKLPRTTHKLLQVLGGKARRMKLLSPKGMDVRPMMEVVKGAAFAILQAAGGCPVSLRPGRWLDLYSGTGSVGIEAVSRGCSEVHFVEMDPWVISDVLRPNLEWTGFLEVSVIHAVRVESFLERAENFVENQSTFSLLHHCYSNSDYYNAASGSPPLQKKLVRVLHKGKDGAFEYISVTPPYMEVDYGVLMDQISKSAVVGEDTFIVVEYPLKTDMLDTCGCLVK